jgi:hypothetical protein
METAAFMQSLQTTLGAHVPAIVGVIALLIVGWFVAVAVRAGVRKSLSALKVNERIGGTTGEKMDVEKGVAVGAFWLIVRIMLIGVFNTLNLELMSDPFNQLLALVPGYLPRCLAGALLLILAWVLATVLLALGTKSLAAINRDEKLAEEAGTSLLAGAIRSPVSGWQIWLTRRFHVPVEKRARAWRWGGRGCLGAVTWSRRA